MCWQLYAAPGYSRNRLEKTGKKKLLKSTVSTGFGGLEAETVETVDFNSFAKSGHLERSGAFLFGFI